MSRRFAAIWFRHLKTDWKIRHQPALKDVPFVMAAPERGRVVVHAASPAAQAKGIKAGMVVADCRAILPALQVCDDQPELPQKLLTAFAEWCIRFTPIAAIDLPDGLILEASGCPHLWGGEQAYLEDVVSRLQGYGYQVRAAMADTIGAAWAVARFGKDALIIPPGKQADALLPLSPAALRLEADVVARLAKLGLYRIGNFIDMPRAALRRRFGTAFLTRLDQALGRETEMLDPVQPPVPHQERLPCLEPIRTATGIEIALEKLLAALCARLADEGKGLRTCVFKGYRIDGNIQQIGIGTNRPSRNTTHLFKLFETRISSLQPDLGFELFVLEAPVVEEVSIEQEMLWNTTANRDEKEITELLDRLGGKLGGHVIHRYLPQEHYWPERSIKQAGSLDEALTTAWRTDLPRPLHLLLQPEPIQVTVPIPDYPPMLFHYKGQLHKVQKADGPERIEQEWWLQDGTFRDYYCVEDEHGRRYWLFRLGSYTSGDPRWFVHGFFA